MLPPKLAMSGWNCAHLGWGELLQTPPHPTAAAPRSPRMAAALQPLPGGQRIGMVYKGVSGAGRAGLPWGAAAGRTDLQERHSVWGLLCSEGVWGLCAPSGFSGMRCLLLLSGRKKKEKGEDVCGHASYVLSQRLVPGFWSQGRKSPGLCALWKVWLKPGVYAGPDGGSSSKMSFWELGGNVIWIQ